MATITAFVLAAFVGYVGFWYVGAIEGNFPLLMFMATVVTGIYWLAEKFYFFPQRKAAADKLQAEADERNAQLHAQGITQTDVNLSKSRLAP